MSENKSTNSPQDNEIRKPDRLKVGNINNVDSGATHHAKNKNSSTAILTLVNKVFGIPELAELIQSHLTLHDLFRMTRVSKYLRAIITSFIYKRQLIINRKSFVNSKTTTWFKSHGRYLLNLDLHSNDALQLVNEYCTNLQYLKCTSSIIYFGNIYPNLPNTLKSLEIINPISDTYHMEFLNVIAESGLTSLEELTIVLYSDPMNKAPTTATVRLIAKMLKSLPKLRYLTLDRLQFENDEVFTRQVNDGDNSDGFDFHFQSKSISVLEFSHFKINLNSLENLMYIFPSFEKLTVYDGNHEIKEGAVFQYLPKSARQSLKILEMKSLTYIALRPILDDSSEFQTLESIYFERCGLVEMVLVNFIKNFGPRLKIFKLCFNRPTMGINFENAIKECPRLEEVDLSYSSATFEVCRQSWACSGTLKSLDLCNISRQETHSNANSVEEHRLASKEFVTQFRNLRELGVEYISDDKFLDYSSTLSPSLPSTLNSYIPIEIMRIRAPTSILTSDQVPIFLEKYPNLKLLSYFYDNYIQYGLTYDVIQLLKRAGIKPIPIF